MVANPEQDFVLKTVESRDVHFVRFWFTDVLGNMKSFAVVPGELESAFEEGMGFDASCIEGFSAAQESDMLAFPDPSTFEILPWRPQANAVARMICDIRTPEGEPYAGDSRHVLERVVRRAAEDGYSFIVGPELEYFYFKDAEGTDVLDQGSYFDMTSLDSASDLRRDTVLTLEKMGIPVEYSHHEKGPSQHEIDLRYADALSMADAVMTYKQVVKEIAMKHGVYASFMPKPMAGEPGSGMICVNGAAAHCVEPGHKVIIMCYAQMTPEEFADPDNAPRVVFVDDDNRIARVTRYEKHGRLEDMQ